MSEQCCQHHQALEREGTVVMASSAGELRLRRSEEEPEYVEGVEEDEMEVKVEVKESVTSVLAEVTPPYLLAGLGMVGAGVVLDTVQYWTVYRWSGLYTAHCTPNIRDLPELFIMVPALIGLKGNLEMTLASRYHYPLHEPKYL